MDANNQPNDPEYGSYKDVLKAIEGPDANERARAMDVLMRRWRTDYEPEISSVRESIRIFGGAGIFADVIFGIPRDIDGLVLLFTQSNPTEIAIFGPTTLAIAGLVLYLYNTNKNIRKIEKIHRYEQHRRLMERVDR